MKINKTELNYSMEFEKVEINPEKYRTYNPYFMDYFCNFSFILIVVFVLVMSTFFIYKLII
jgi:hypothetical protein